MAKPVSESAANAVKPRKGSLAKATEEEERIAKEEALIAHFNELVPAGRGNWLALLAYLTFIFVTVLAVEDIDFFLPQRSTALPLINVTIPTRSFFIFAPILGAALYIYLHFNIRQVVEVFSDLPWQHKGQSLQTFLKPWILVDHLHRVSRPGPPRRMDALAGITTILMVWLAGPFVLSYFWIRSWPAHSEWITAVIGLSLAGCIYAGLSTWMLFRKVKYKRGDPINVVVVSGAVVATLILVGFVRTDWGGYMALKHGSIEIESLLAETDLQKAFLTTQDAGSWRNREAFGRELAQAACDRAGVPKAICGADIEESDDPRALALLERGYLWCAEQFGLSRLDCDVLRDEILFDVIEEWPRRSRELYSGSPSLDLSGVDLRRANLREATIRNVDFTGANLSGADFTGAVLENVDFGGANLSDAVFARAEIAETRFSGTNLSGTAFTDARLRSLTFFGSSSETSVGTSFVGSNIRGAYFFFGEFEQVNFSDADIGSAFFLDVSFNDSNLQDVRIKNSSLIDVELPGADWGGAWLRRSLIATVMIGDAEIELDQLEDLVVLSEERWAAAEAARPGPRRSGQGFTVELEPVARDDADPKELAEVSVEVDDVLGAAASSGMLGERFELPTCWARVPQEVKTMLWWYTRTPISHPEDYGPTIAAITCD